MVKIGRYRHYKGGIYRVVLTALDTVTSSPVVVYMNETHGTFYVRPLKDFTAKVMEDSEDGGVPRFKFLDESKESNSR